MRHCSLLHKSERNNAPEKRRYFPTIDFMTIGSAACSKKVIDIPESATANRRRDAEHLDTNDRPIDTRATQHRG